MPELAAHLERVAKEIVEPLRERARQSLAYLDDLIAQARTGTEISLYEGTRDKTLAQFDKLEQEIAAALAACALEAEEPFRTRLRGAVDMLERHHLCSLQGDIGCAVHEFIAESRALERAVGEKGRA